MFNNRIFHFVVILQLICFLVSSIVMAQHKCHTQENFLRLEKINPKRFNQILNFQQKLSLKKNDAARDGILGEEIIYTIPVVVHVMHNNASGTIGGIGNINITDAQIKSQIEVLNEDFRKKINTKGYNTHPVGADVKIEFCLADRAPDGKPSAGINRIFYGKSIYEFTNYEEEKQMKAMSYWPSDRYLNIWVVGMNGVVLGISQFPYSSGLEGLNDPDDGALTDGIIVQFDAFGRVGNLAKFYDLGRTATHEVGHWLGLLHIWGDQYCGDDFVSDTPPQAQSNKNLSTKCPVTYSNCSGTVTVDMSNNYMDYSPDLCLNIFTLQQKQRMRAALAISPRRAALLNNTTSCTYLPSANLEVDHSLQNIKMVWTENIIIISTENRIEACNVMMYNVLGEMIFKTTLPAFENEYVMATPSMGRTSESMHFIIIETIKGKIIKKIVPSNR